MFFGQVLIDWLKRGALLVECWLIDWLIEKRCIVEMKNELYSFIDPNF